MNDYLIGYFPFAIPDFSDVGRIFAPNAAISDII